MRREPAREPEGHAAGEKAQHLGATVVATLGAPTPLLSLPTTTTRYPSAARPSRGVFVGNRLRHLAAGGEASAMVLPSMPCLPLRSPLFGPRAGHPAMARLKKRPATALHHPPSCDATRAPAARLGAHEATAGQPAP